MQGDVSLLAIFPTQVSLDLPGQLVRLMNGHSTIHSDMHLNSDVVADVASTQVMR